MASTPPGQNSLRPEDPYAALGLGPTATLDEIKGAYFTLVRAHPPERDPEAFKRIRAAYERLRTAEGRLEADMLRLRPWPDPPIEDLDAGSALDLSVAPDDVIRAARAFSDLGRRDFREDFREVRC